MNDTLRRNNPPPMTLFLMLGFVVTGLSMLLTLPGLDTDSRVLADTDGYMRFVRIADLRSGEVGWFESFEERSNAPFGHSMHWTRPQDVVVIVISLLLQPILGSADGLYAAAVASGPLLLGFLSGVAAWAAYPLVGRVGAVVAGLGVVLQPGLASYGAAGRVDHHALILGLVGLMLGIVVRLARTPSTRLAMAGGVAAAAGVWVSTEFLLPIGLCLLVAAWVWVREGAVVAELALIASGAWVVAMSAALLIERGARDLGTTELDRISWVHLLVAALVFGFWLLAVWWSDGGALGRLARGSILATTALGVVLLTVPGFLAGPFGDVPAELWDAWLGGVAELQPLWPFGTGFERSLYLLVAPVLGLGLAVFAARRGQSAVWWGIAGAIAVTTLLAATQLRFSTYPQLLATLPWAWVAARLVARTGDGRSLGSSLARIGAMLLGAGGFLVPVLVVALVAGSDTEQSPATARCDFAEMVTIVQEKDAPVVVAHIDSGPQLLYRTDAGVLATPYHRNVDGILDARSFFLDTPARAQMIAFDRGIDLVFLCPSRDRGYLGPAADAPGSMYQQLVAGEQPPWLVPIPTDDDLLAFEVAAHS